VSGDDARGRLELRRRGVRAADPFAEAGHPEQIVADGAAALAEVVPDPSLGLAGRIGREQRTHADRQPVLAPQPQRVLLIVEVARR
jgi:hypothetical protein